MSVILYDVAEVAAVLGQYRATCGHLLSDPGTPSVDDLGRALRAFHYANCAAYAMTYDDSEQEGVTYQGIQAALAAVPFSYGWLANPKIARRRIVRTLRGFLYNAVSNGGTDFMPTSYREIFESAIRAISDDLAGIYREDEAA